ncbi:fumarylacetoacetate hydrolase family protein [Caballeronia sp. LZ029]|uniref:fumarylacetoacetate hydrolase family protein n=1 Tax=Caballeronia sp. LZ029 TaxID=3038564 RepID=UPI0038575D8D
MIAFASQGVELSLGDLIFSGIPAGVGALQSGDVVQAGVGGVARIEFEIGNL